jgi:hypothetical protein
VGVADLPTLCCTLCQVEDLSYILPTEATKQCRSCSILVA